MRLNILLLLGMLALSIQFANSQSNPLGGLLGALTSALTGTVASVAAPVVGTVASVAAPVVGTVAGTVANALSILNLASCPASLPPNTPADNIAIIPDLTCALENLLFSNGLLLNNFKPNVFHYTANCNGLSNHSYTVATPILASLNAMIDISINGQLIHSPNKSTGLSNGGHIQPYGPYSSSNNLYYKTGLNTIVIGVGYAGAYTVADMLLGKPGACYYQYTIQCTTPPGICGDPQFLGLNGQDYQIHGVSGEVYNIISDSQIQYNSRFVFLDSGRCPIDANGKKMKGCWSHPGSYLGALGLKTKAGDKIRIVPGSARHGFKLVELNGKALKVGDSINLAGVNGEDFGQIAITSSHTMTLNLGAWSFEFDNSDKFINQRVQVAGDHARTSRSHGLLGQTWSDATYPGPLKYVQGSVDDYSIRDGDIYGDSFFYNRFS
jgi:hypothetical protein